jgi:hypothetical protein
VFGTRFRSSEQAILRFEHALSLARPFFQLKVFRSELSGALSSQLKRYVLCCASSGSAFVLFLFFSRLRAAASLAAGRGTEAGESAGRPQVSEEGAKLEETLEDIA